jgi:hypothetical protein
MFDTALYTSSARATATNGANHNSDVSPCKQLKVNRRGSKNKPSDEAAT